MKKTNAMRILDGLKIKYETLSYDDDVSYHYLIDMSEFVEVVVYTLYHYHSLSAAIYGKCHILNALCGNLYFGQLAYICQNGIIGGNGLSFCRHYLKLWVEAGKERCYQIVESIKYRKRYHQRHCGYGYANDRNSTYDVDGMSGFLREQISAGYEEGKVHFFSSSSICSI